MKTFVPLAAKARGTKLRDPDIEAARAAGSGQAGWTAGSDGNRIAADKFARDVLPIIEDIRADGITTLTGIAAALNLRGILTARGGRWYATTVSNLIARFAA